MLLRISGFTDKQFEILEQGLNGIQLQVGRDEFNQSVERYIRSIKNQSKNYATSQAFKRLGQLSETGSFQPETLIAAAESLEPNDLVVFIQSVLSNNQIRTFLFGNYDEKDLSLLVGKLESTRGKIYNKTPYVKTKVWKPEAGSVIVYQEDIDVADVGMIDMFIYPTPGLEQRAKGLILKAHLTRSVFDILRTEEQLAYSVGGFSKKIKNYTGIGVYIQTPVNNLEDMQSRFDQFRLDYRKQLKQLTESSFQKLKESALIGLNEKPKNFYDEVSNYLDDWYEEKFDFDSKTKLIHAVEKVTLSDVIDFYEQTMVNESGARLSIQLRGNKFSDAPYPKLKNQSVFTNITDFYKKIKYQ
jgi:protease-3